MQEIIHTILQECTQLGDGQPYNRKTIISSVSHKNLRLEEKLFSILGRFNFFAQV